MLKLILTHKRTQLINVYNLSYHKLTMYLLFRFIYITSLYSYLVMSNSVIRQRDVNVNLLEYANINRDQGFFSNVTFVAGNETIQANRLVLSCYSTYLEEMFKFQERNLRPENIIEIKSVDGKALKALIDFIYTGSITISEQNVKNLLSGAEYLKMHEVKQFCFEFLRSNITVDNSLDFLKTVGNYKNEGLIKEMQQYISISFDKVLQTDDFKQLSNEELISCISNLDRSQVNESSIFQGILTWTNDDKIARKDNFLELFKLINLAKITPVYLKKKILEEKLVTNSNDCYKLALNAYHKHAKKNTSDQTSKLIRLGGFGASHKVTVVYDLSNGSSKNYPDLPQNIYSHCSLPLNDYIYCIGGSKTSRFMRGINDVCKLNLKKQNSGWEQVASLNTKRCNMGAAVYDDVMVVAGGANENYETFASTEVYQPSFNKWQAISPLKRQRSGHALVSCDGYLYTIGGWDRNCLSSVERLGDLKEEWINIEPMQTPRGLVAAVNCDEEIYAIGGKSGNNISTTLKTVEKYDSSANKWKYVSDMNFKRRAHAACVLRNKIYVVGGLDADDKVVTQIECYEPTCDTWSIVGSTSEEWYYHTLVAV